jgi:hypothetical protein
MAVFKGAALTYPIYPSLPNSSARFIYPLHSDTRPRRLDRNGDMGVPLKIGKDRTIGPLGGGGSATKGLLCQEDTWRVGFPTGQV